MNTNTVIVSNVSADDKMDEHKYCQMRWMDTLSKCRSWDGWTQTLSNVCKSWDEMDGQKHRLVVEINIVPTMQHSGQDCAAHLVVRASPNVHTTLLYSSTGYLSKLVSCTKLLASVSVPLTSLSTPAYLSDILHLYSPARPFRSSADTRLLILLLYKQDERWSCLLSFWPFCLELIAITH